MLQQHRTEASDRAEARPASPGPDNLLDRNSTAEALTHAGFRTAPSTLATKAVRGGGPPYQLFGRKPLYRWSDALEWARSRLSAPRRTTSEHAASARFEDSAELAKKPAQAAQPAQSV